MEQTTMSRLEGHEVLQPSSLEKYNWPAYPWPNQTTRSWTGADARDIIAAARNIKLQPEHLLRETAKLPTVAARLQWLLSHDAINFNGVTRVRNEPKWQARLAASVAAGEPIHIAYPLFCAIANPAKQLTRPGPNAAEFAAIHFFKYVHELATLLYAPGIHVHILSDAVLYNNALQNTPAFAYRYIRQAEAMVIQAKAEHCVTIHDYAALLAPHAKAFDALYNGFYARMLRGDAVLISAEQRFRLLRSIRANLNVERFGLTYADLKAIYGPKPDPTHPLAPEIERMARQALHEQLAVKLACVELDLPQQLWPNHIRASCHKGMKNGVAVLGLRVYPEYYQRSQLLPYHGKPLLRADGRLIVEPEILLRARPDLIRVETPFSESFLYREEMRSPNAE